MSETENEIAQVKSNAPQVPWTIDLVTCVRHFTRLPDGGVVLHFTPAQQLPNGQFGLMPPQVTIRFSREAWDAFKGEVVRDGETIDIAIAREMPRMDIPRGKQ